MLIPVAIMAQMLRLVAGRKRRLADNRFALENRLALCPRWLSAQYWQLITGSKELWDLICSFLQHTSFVRLTISCRSLSTCKKKIAAVEARILHRTLVQFKRHYRSLGTDASR